MKQVIVNNDSNTVQLNDLIESIPIFARKSNKLVGMIIEEYFLDEAKWVLRTGGGDGFFVSETRKDCLLNGLSKGYSFYIED